MTSLIERLKAIPSEMRDAYTSSRRPAMRNLLAAGALAASMSCADQATSPAYGPATYTPTTKTDTVKVTKTDSLYFASIPVAIDTFQVATLCPPESWASDGRPTPRWRFRINQRNSFYGSNDITAVPRHFSNGCPDQKTPRVAESVTVGYVFNLELLNTPDPTHPYHGQIIEGVYVTPVIDQSGAPGTVERGKPNEAKFWKVQFARQNTPNASGFTKAVRNGVDIIINDVIDNMDIANSGSSSEQFIPIKGPYLIGTRARFSENPTQLVRIGPYKTQAQADSAALAYGAKLRSGVILDR
jgi:hypothetical protein